MSAPEPLLSPEDIAGLTGISYHGVLRDIRSGKLKATRKGKGYRVMREWYDEWLLADVVAPARPRARRTGRAARASVTVDDLDAIEREAAAA